MRLGKAVYWEATSQDEHGDYVYALPIDMDVRWQNSSRVLEDDQITYAGFIYVDRKVPIGSRLMEDTEVKDLEAPLPPPVGSREVRRFDDIPDIDYEETLHRVMI